VADNRIKKVIINKASLPPLNGDIESYVVRYRIISEDRNRVSHWSPQFYVSANAPEVEDLSNIEVTKSQDSIIVTWNLDDDAEIPQTDVFVAWGSDMSGVGLYEYYATVIATSITIPIPNGKGSVDVRVQLSVYPRRLVDSRLIADSGIQSLV
jgi:hypothetical protein